MGKDAQDRITQQIEQISRLLPQLIKQLENRKIAQARRTVEDCFSVLRLDRETIRTEDPETIIASIADSRLLVQLADLLAISVRLSPDEAVRRLHRAVTAHIDREMLSLVK